MVERPGERVSVPLRQHCLVPPPPTGRMELAFSKSLTPIHHTSLDASNRIGTGKNERIRQTERNQRRRAAAQFRCRPSDEIGGGPRARGGRRSNSPPRKPGFAPK